MYDDSITTTGAQELLNARLAQAEANLRGTPVTTREDLLATVYSALNAVLSLGNNITPLFPVAREGPAIAGDLNDNFRILNQDAQAIIKQLLGTENDAATLFNLFASSQNNLRQTIREAVYTSGSRRYVEEFISNTKLGASTAAVDFNAGVVSLPLVSETFLKPDSIDFGVASVGALGEGTTDLLLDGLTETSMTWTGSRLELVFNFNTIQILNRFRIDLAGYQGLVVEEFSSSPDGVLREDLLAELQPSSRSLDGSSGKFSGDWIADFDPRLCRMHSTKMFFSRNKLWAATHALLFDKFGDLRDGSTSLKPGVRVHSPVFPLARARRLQRKPCSRGRHPGCNRAPILGRRSPPGTLHSGHGRRRSQSALPQPLSPLAPA